jgi:hypothetical protein
MPRTMLTALLLFAGLLAGCGGDDDGGNAGDGGAAQSSTSQSAPTASPSPSGAGGDDGGDSPQPPFPATTQPDTQQASADARGNVTDIRVGRHEGYDRVVFEFDGAGTPGWDVRYTEQPSRQGSGERVDLAGNAALQVTITGVGYPYDTGIEEYSGPRPPSADGTEVVTEVFFDGTFEGVTAALVGTESEVPFRVYLLQDPARVVLDVADAS